MESVRNWLEQTIGMPIDYICIIIMGMLTLHVLKTRQDWLLCPLLY